MGLRERKRTRVRAAIIQNAIALFRQNGYEAVRVAAIAAEAELSEATFFNYFPSKDAVLGEWAHAGVEAAVGEGVRNGRGQTLRRWLREAAWEVAAAVEADRALSELAWSRARLEPALLERCAGSADARRTLEEAIGAAQSRNDLRADLPAEAIAAMVLETLKHGVAIGLRRGTPRRTLARDLQQRLDLVLDGARKRNERVRAGAVASGYESSAM